MRGINLVSCTISNFYNINMQQITVELPEERGNVIDMADVVGEENLDKITYIYADNGGSSYNRTDGITYVNNEYFTYDSTTGILKLKKYSDYFEYGYEISGNYSLCVNVAVSYGGTNVLTEDNFATGLLELLQYNGYYFLTEEKLSTVTYLYCEAFIPFNLKGLDLLTGLESLYISTEGNDAINLTPWKNLKELYLSYSGSTTPEITYADGVVLTGFGVWGSMKDLSFVPSTIQCLAVGDCENIFSLDLSRFTSLTSLTLNQNTTITSVDLSSIASLKELTVYSCSALKSLNVSGTSLEKLTLTGNKVLSSVNLEGINTIKEVSVSGNSALTSLNFNASPIEKMEIIGAGLSFTVKNWSALEELCIKGTAVTDLDLEGSAVKTVELENCDSLKKLSLKGCTCLESITVSYNDVLENVDISDSSAKKVHVYSNQSLTSVSFDGCSALEQLSLTYNAVTALDLSDCTALTGQNVSIGRGYGTSSTNYDCCIDCRNNAIEKLVLADFAEAYTVYASAKSALHQWKETALKDAL